MNRLELSQNHKDFLLKIVSGLLDANVIDFDGVYLPDLYLELLDDLV